MNLTRIGNPSIRTRWMRHLSKSTSIPVPLLRHNRIVLGDTSIPYTWLLDHCQCPLCIHSSTRQKLHSSGSVNISHRPSLATIHGNTLCIEWCHGHKSVYSHAFLKKNNTATPSIPPEFKSKLWTSSDINAHPIEYAEFSTPLGFKSALSRLSKHGICFLKNVPTQLKQVETVASVFGPIMNTFYGVSWDVKSIPQSKNIAYTNLYLGFHMDLM